MAAAQISAPDTRHMDSTTDTDSRNCINLCSFNMHGFSNSSSYLKDLCFDNDLIFVQEHWLMTQHLSKFDGISSNFIFQGVSAMDMACAQGILRGRPFGGVGVLIRKSLSSHISLCGHQQDNRAIAVKLDYNDLHVICVGVYFPCDRSSPEYINSICSINGFIESVIDDNPGYKILITGDFNFQCIVGDKGYDVFSSFANDLDLTCCDSMDLENIGFTYFHETLGQKSFIDHFFVHREVQPLIRYFKIVEDGANLSDHLPITLCLAIPAKKMC
jgi:exonuclease III